MRTVRCSGEGVSAWGSVCRRGCLPARVFSQVVSARGISAEGGVYPAGCVCLGEGVVCPGAGKCVSQHALRQTPTPPTPRHWNKMTDRRPRKYYLAVTSLRTVIRHYPELLTTTPLIGKQCCRRAPTAISFFRDGSTMSFSRSVGNGLK